MSYALSGIRPLALPEPKVGPISPSIPLLMVDEPWANAFGEALRNAMVIHEQGEANLPFANGVVKKVGVLRVRAANAGETPNVNDVLGTIFASGAAVLMPLDNLKPASGVYTIVALLDPNDVIAAADAKTGLLALLEAEHQKVAVDAVQKVAAANAGTKTGGGSTPGGSATPDGGSNQASAAGDGKGSYLPWVIGGVALLGVAALMMRKPGYASNRRHRH